METSLALPTPTRGLDFRNLDARTPVVIESGDGCPIVMTPANVLEWVAPGAPLTDALRFLLVCRNARLNPLLGEAYLLPMGKSDVRYQVIVSKYGYLKRAQSHAEYAGHQSGITVWHNGDFVDIEGTIRPPVPGLPVVGGWGKVWRKDTERPVYVRLGLDEFRKDSHVWRSIPNTMIAKVALVSALREAFSWSDSYDESEVDYDLPAAPKPPAGNGGGNGNGNGSDNDGTIDVSFSAPPVAEAAGEELPQLSYRTSDTIGYSKPEMVVQVTNLAVEAGLTADEFVAAVSRRGVNEVSDLTVTQAEEIMVNLRRLITENQADEVFGPSATQAEVVPAESTSPPAPDRPEEVVIPEVVRGGEPAVETTS